MDRATIPYPQEKSNPIFTLFFNGKAVFLKIILCFVISLNGRKRISQIISIFTICAYREKNCGKISKTVEIVVEFIRFM